jgi:hypothetical protein
MAGRFFPESLGCLIFSLPFFLAIPAFGADGGTPKAVSSVAAQQHAQEETFGRERLAYWQRRLGLNDWNITLMVCRAGELRPQTVGNLHWDAGRKTAVIRVLDVADYGLAPDAAMRDVENTVVHELVHLELSSMPRSDASIAPEELAVSRLVDALLKLERSE